MAITHLFIDTNVLLNFYSFADDDLSQLQLLINEISDDGICLHLPQQVVNELERNREAKLKDAADQFGKEGGQSGVPRHMQAYPQYQEYIDSSQETKRLRGKLISLALADASNKTLETDVRLQELFAKAKRYEEDDAVFSLGLQRMQKGNPPGKNGSVGDQYNWEVLLKEVPNDDLYIISKDGDFVSKLNKGRPHPFLESEWRVKKNSNLHIYNELRAFLTRYSQIRLQVSSINEVASPAFPQPSLPSTPLPAGVPLAPVAPPLNPAKDAAVLSLVNSTSFMDTHAAIANLQQYISLFTRADAERLIRAAVENDQVRWIASDSDVFGFFGALIVEHSDIDEGVFDEAVEVFGLRPEPDNASDD